VQDSKGKESACRLVDIKENMTHEQQRKSEILLQHSKLKTRGKEEKEGFKKNST